MTKCKKICILGLGYIGLPTASTFATHGLRVVGVDVNPQVVETLRNGGLHIHEPGLRTLVQAALGSGNLTVNNQPEEADAFIIAVPTPFYEEKRADLRAVKAAAEAIVPYLRKGNLVVLESTSPPRTTRDVLAPILERSGLKARVDFHLTYVPERVLPGQILRELIENDRVIGGYDQASAEAGRELYALFVRGEMVLSDCTTAEMVKLMENTYRDVNIAIANEFARLAERFGVDAWEAIALANRHPRVNILNPGPGVGGHCISVDPWFLVEAAPDLATLIRTAREVNDSQPEFVVQFIQRAAGQLDGLRVALLGLAYKPDVDDLRESPAVEIAQRLMAAGAQVVAYEPYKPAAQLEGITTVSTLEEAVRSAGVLVVLVAHTPFRELNTVNITALTTARIIIDCCQIWEKESLKWDNISYYKLGVGTNLD